MKRKATRDDRRQQQEDRAWEAGRQYGEQHPLAEVGSTEEMYQAAQDAGVAFMFDVFKYGAQSVWRETGQLSDMVKRRRADLLHRSDIELLSGSKRDVPVWDSHVLDNLNYQDAYEGEADELQYMAHAIAELDDTEAANKIAAALDLDFEPAGPDDEPTDVWDDLVQALARAHYPTWRTSELPAGQYDLGILGDEFGFVFHADEEGVYQLRQQLHGADEGEAFTAAARNIEQPAEAAVQEALRLLYDVKSEALLRRWPYEVGRAAHMAIQQVEFLLQSLNENDLA